MMQSANKDQMIKPEHWTGWKNRWKNHTYCCPWI